MGLWWCSNEFRRQIDTALLRYGSCGMKAVRICLKFSIVERVSINNKLTVKSFMSLKNGWVRRFADLQWKLPKNVTDMGQWTWKARYSAFPKSLGARVHLAQWFASFSEPWSTISVHNCDLMALIGGGHKLVNSEWTSRSKRSTISIIPLCKPLEEHCHFHLSMLPYTTFCCKILQGWW